MPLPPTPSNQLSTHNISGMVVLVVIRVAVSTPVNDARVILPVGSKASSVNVPEK
jgi:hypothetical protein